jgi:hypothetical protein
MRCQSAINHPTLTGATKRWKQRRQGKSRSEVDQRAISARLAEQKSRTAASTTLRFSEWHGEREAPEVLSLDTGIARQCTKVSDISSVVAFLFFSIQELI